MEVFTIQQVRDLYKEFQSYQSMWNVNLATINYREELRPVGFDEWLSFYCEGWSNDEIIRGHQVSA